MLETLEPLPGDRKCFRMINGVLVERTVQDVLPQLKTNADGLKKVLEDLLKQYTTKQEELEKWKVRRSESAVCFVRQPVDTITASKQDPGCHAVSLFLQSHVRLLVQHVMSVMQLGPHPRQNSEPPW